MGVFESAVDFYMSRDDRTNRYGDFGSTYQNAKVLVICSPEKMKHYSGQLMALVATNILSRFCRHITVIAPNELLNPVLQDDQLYLSDQIICTMQNADPFGNFSITEDIGSQKNADWDCILLIGSPFVGLEITPTLSIDGDGWIACIGNGSKDFKMSFQGNLNPVGPGMAASIGICNIFKIVTGSQDRDSMIERVCVSGYDFTEAADPFALANPPLPISLDLGRCLMVGVGMVGSDTLYFLKKTALAGSLTLIDNDEVKVLNLNRSLLFGVKDCGTFKVSVGASYMKHSNLHTDAIPERFNLENLRQFDLILPLANEHGIRNAIQTRMPPLILHTAVSRGWGVNLYRHIPLNDYCLNCYPMKDQLQPQYSCSTSEIESDSVRIDVALPFLPALAGVLLVGEIIKLQYNEYPITTYNTIYMELLEQVRIVSSHKLVTDNDCDCKHPDTRKVHREFIQNSKYYFLSEQM